MSSNTDTEELTEEVKLEYNKLPINPKCTCMKIYNFYKPKPCKCTDDMKARNKCCYSCNLTQRRTCHYNCEKNSWSSKIAKLQTKV
jgi:hypothetical protein